MLLGTLCGLKPNLILESHKVLDFAFGTKSQSRITFLIGTQFVLDCSGVCTPFSYDENSSWRKGCILAMSCAAQMATPQEFIRWFEGSNHSKYCQVNKSVQF